ncbi:MAG TPA: hypothetical protein VF605_15315 [Allosphingosinicella sp.]
MSGKADIRALQALSGIDPLPTFLRRLIHPRITHRGAAVSWLSRPYRKGYSTQAPEGDSMVIFDLLSFAYKAIGDRQKSQREAQRDSAIIVRQASQAVKGLAACSKDDLDNIRYHCGLLSSIMQKIDPRIDAARELKDWYYRIFKSHGIESWLIPAGRPGLAMVAPPGSAQSIDHCISTNKEILSSRLDLLRIAAALDAAAALLESGTYGGRR